MLNNLDLTFNDYFNVKDKYQLTEETNKCISDAEKLKEQPNFVLNSFFKLIDNFCLKSVSKIVVNSDLLKNYLINNRNIVENKIEVIHHFSPYQKSSYIIL